MNEAEAKKKQELQQILDFKGLSARQRNQAKRKLKAKESDPAAAKSLNVSNSSSTVPLKHKRCS